FAVNGSCCSPARVIAPGRLFHERPPGGWGRPVWGTAPGRAGTNCRTSVRTGRGVGAEGHRRRFVTLLVECGVDGRHQGAVVTVDGPGHDPGESVLHGPGALLGGGDVVVVGPEGFSVVEPRRPHRVGAMQFKTLRVEVSPVLRAGGVDAL